MSAAALIDRLAHGAAVPRSDLVGSNNLGGGSGGRSGIFVEIGDDFFKSRATRRYDSLEAALAAEGPREVFRRETGLYHPRRVWFVTRGGDGGYWVGSLTPRLTVLRERFNRGAGDRAWALYLTALRWTFELGYERRAWLDCNPNNFGDDGAGLYYLDDDLLFGDRPLPIAVQALVRLREYPAAHPRLRAAFLERFCLLVQAQAAAGKLAGALVADLENRVLWPPEPALRRRLEQLLSELGGSA